ncbi:glycosyltransferase family 9 protein [Oscillatoria sp. CS-180]|uniref:glycosyltransferase family 9 protein n=1 Tax=Oscillatoria sp. CS-180 TaxID=3021720 RepID=UPI00232B44EA|nr:glycosyltransferase family 9 protein [Oscillatoria sp. CS-180]MDB9526505.1 glycosyltransferase family 9 protein [Oscillatoria sp. CS-180]
MACRLLIPADARILVVRSLPGLGDLLCSVPALRSLRAAFPFARITWLGLSGTEWFGQRFAHLLDDWRLFPGFPGIPEGWQGPDAIVRFLHQVHRHPYDLTLQFHGNGSAMNCFLTLLKGRQQAGFYLPGQYCPDPDYFLPYPQDTSEVNRLLQFMAFLGMPEPGTELEFPLSQTEYQLGLETLKAHSLTPGQYVCVHPGASSEERRWSTAGFAQVVHRLTHRGYRVVLTGTAAEQNLARQVLAAIGASIQSPINLTGQTSLSTLAVLLQYSALLISNDTGISHLASALKVPSVVVFSNSDIQRWAPSDRTCHRIVDSRQMGAATAEAVLLQAESLLSTQFQHRAIAEVCHAR